MDQIYLKPTAIIDSDSKPIIEHAMGVVDEANNPVERAVKLYYAVRDGIRLAWYSFWIETDFIQCYSNKHNINVGF